MKKNNKGFTLVELLATIAVLAVVLLGCSILYTNIHKNILQKQYENVKSLIENGGVKFANDYGNTSFFVEDLIKYGYIEPDDHDDIYDPRDKTSLNCNVVNVSSDKNNNLIAVMSEKQSKKDGKCFNNTKTNSDVVLTAKLTETNVVYPSDKTYTKQGDAYPSMIRVVKNVWTNSQLDVFAEFKNKDVDLNGAKIIWNDRQDAAKEFVIGGENKTTTTFPAESVYNGTFKADIWTKDMVKYTGKLDVHFDVEPPYIDESRVKLLNPDEENKWTQGKTVVLTVTDKDGVGLSKIYIGSKPCSELKINATLGQNAVPGMVQTFRVTEEVGAEGKDFNVCAIDKLGNVSSGNTIRLYKIDTTPPDINVKTFTYIANNADSYNGVTPLKNLTNENTSFDVWNNIGYAFLLSATDNASGVTAGTWSWNGSGSNSYYNSISKTTVGSTNLTVNITNFVTLTGGGKRYAEVTYTDEAGNSRTVTVQVNIDLVAPTISTTISNQNWTNQNVTATTKYSDVGSGISTSTVTATCNNSNVSISSSGITTTGFTDTWSSERNQSCYYTVCDSVGNCANSSSFNIKIDKTAPTCASSGGSSTWTKNNITLTGTCTDTGGSGCQQSSITKVISTDTNATVSPGTVYDNAGNSKDCSGQTVKVDKTAPTCTSSGGSSSWTKNNVTLTGTCSDSGSGCKQSSVTKTISANTNTSVSPGTVYDNAGNSKDCSGQTVKIDKTAPTFNIAAFTHTDGKTKANDFKGITPLTTTAGNFSYTNTSNDANSVWNNVGYDFTFDPSDSGGSGIASFVVKYNNSGSFTLNTSLTNTENILSTSYFNLTGQGRRYAEVTLTDNAGNSVTKTIQVNIDKTAPTFNIAAFTHTDGKTKANDFIGITPLTTTSGNFSYNNTSNDAGSIWNNVGYDFVFDPKDNESGIASFVAKYNTSGSYSLSKSIPNSENIIGTSYFNLTGEGRRYAEVTLTDKAGNKTTKKIEVNIDKAAPTISASVSTQSCTTGNVSATINYSDSGSGINTSSLTPVCSSGSTTISGSAGSSSATDSWSTRRNETCWYKICDKAGNCSTSNTFTINTQTSCGSSGGGGSTQSCPSGKSYSFNGITDENLRPDHIGCQGYGGNIPCVYFSVNDAMKKIITSGQVSCVGNEKPYNRNLPSTTYTCYASNSTTYICYNSSEIKKYTDCNKSGSTVICESFVTCASTSLGGLQNHLGEKVYIPCT